MLGDKPSPTRLDPSFAEILGGDHLTMGEANPGSVIGTWPDGRIGYVNQAFVDFAIANQAGPRFLEHWGPGAALFDCIPKPMREHYAKGHDVAERGEMWEHIYSCPSPTTDQRFRLRVYPLSAGAGLLHVHTLVWRRQREAAARAGVEDVFSNEHGLVVQCSSCRHVQRQDRPAQWDFVLQYLVAPPSMTHSLCPACAPHYGWGSL